MGNTTIAFIVTTIVYLMRFFPTVGEGAHLLFKIVSDAKSGKDVTALLHTQGPADLPAARSAGEISRIDMRGLGFAYEGGTDTNILKGVDACFDGGKSYALTGKSGAGKSTLMDILLKFYPPTEGELDINGTAIADIRDSDIRKRIILVSQEAAIFDDSVLNNIRLGMDASLSEVRSACESACVDEFIMAMPDGYSTRLHYQGKNLSGGQRQRIAIARALLRKPDVLILDESTSALDKATQEQVLGNVLREYQGKILIFVTHDPHIMRRVDEVVDLQQINGAAARRSRSGAAG
jgi:ABC-type multidrug transport system fused ATPase/permease subunit